MAGRPASLGHNIFIWDHTRNAINMKVRDTNEDPTLLVQPSAQRKQICEDDQCPRRLLTNTSRNRC